MQTQRIKRESGFSILELLTVIALMGIISAIAVPSMSGFMNQYQLQAAANQLAFEAGRARLQAVAQNAWIRIDTTSVAYRRSSSNDGTTYTAVTGSQVNLPKRVTTSVAGGPLVFNRNGLATSSVVFTLSNPAGTKTVSVNLIGRVTIS